MTIAKGMLGSAVLLAALSLPLQAAEPVKVGSKIDTEGALLGNIILQVLESHGVKTVNKVQLGTTPVVRGAITSGELDIYPEYTGNGAFPQHIVSANAIYRFLTEDCNIRKEVTIKSFNNVFNHCEDIKNQEMDDKVADFFAHR